MRHLRVLAIAFVFYLVVGFAGLPGQASAHSYSMYTSTEHTVLIGRSAPPKTQIVYSQATLTAKNVGAFSVDCPKDTHVVGGGYFMDTKGTNVYVLASTPFQKEGMDYWGVEINNDTSSSIPLLISAVCVS